MTLYMGSDSPSHQIAPTDPPPVVTYFHTAYANQILVPADERGHLFAFLINNALLPLPPP